MKSLTPLAMTVAALLLAGCETFYHDARQADTDRQEAVRIEMARLQQLRDLDMLKARAESADLRLQQIDARLDRLEGAPREAVTPAAETAALRREVEQLRAERESLKREVVDDLSREMAKLLATQPAAAPRGGSRSTQERQSGYEHKVLAGQTLSEIAATYKVPVEKIKQANGLKDDTIRVGQVLFVPD